MKAIYPKQWIWFLLGFGLFFFTRTSSFIPIAIALAPIFILRLIKDQKPLRGIGITVAGFVLILEMNFWTPLDLSSPFPFIFTFIRSLLLGIVLALPYIVTRLVQRQKNSFVSTLIFPVAAVAVYYLDSVLGPFKGVVVFYAYSQYGNLPLVQLLSLAGIWILIFLLSWFSSVVVWWWDHDFRWENTKKGMAVFLTVAIGFLIYGGARVSPYSFDYDGNTVRVASVVFHHESDGPKPGIDKMLNERLFTPLQETLDKVRHYTFEAASAHSEIIVFQEFSLIIPEEEEAEAILSFQELARDHGVYLCISYVSMPELLEGEHKEFMGYMELSDEEEEGRNMAVLIDDRGEIVATYQKHHLVFGESTWVLEGPGIIPVVETPHGRVGLVICRDMEFSDYMRQAGKQDADIVLAPSYEAISSLSITYAQMLRSVEQGFSFVRPCANGLSVAVDFHGRVLSSTNSFKSSQSVMYADVPTKGRKTLYTFTGDLFAWMCIFVLCGFILLAKYPGIGRR